MTVRHLVVITACAVALVAGVGCDPGAVYEPVGMTRPSDDARSISALYLPCGDEKIRSITLFERGADGPVRDRPLWSIEALGSGANAPEYILGRAPPGFLPKVRLEEMPAQRTDLVVEFETSKGTSRLEFTPADVEQGKVYTRDTEGEPAVLQPDVFGARSQRLCANG